MDNTHSDEKKPLNKYRFPYKVNGVRFFSQAFYVAEGATIEEAAHNAVTKLTEIWTQKIGGKVNTASQAQVAVMYKTDPEFVNDYQI